MAENEDTEFEHEISERLKKLDAQISAPEIPDAQTIFERAKTKKSDNVRHFKWSKISTVAAAVVILCIAIPLAIHNPFLKTVSQDVAMEPTAMEENGNVMLMKTAVSGAMEENAEIEEAEESMEEAPMEPNPEESAPESAEPCNRQQYGEDDNMDCVEIGLSNYFSENKSMNMSDEKIGYVSDSVSHFEDKLSKKRSIEVDVNDSVSVILYDISGETEILSEFWVEGTYITSNFDGEIYVIDMFLPIDKAEFESGDYLPLIGDSKKGTYQLSKEDITVEDEITEAIILMAVNIDVESGSYTIDAVLK